jgi:murein DD-endopeptidase MepM/ murein hydrolase activator NlpD
MQTLYGHLKGFSRGLSKGDRVEQNEVIGYVGKTGLATGYHLHFEMIESGRQIDPLAFDNEPAEPIPTENLKAYVSWAAQVRALGRELVSGQVVPALAPGAGPRSSDLALLSRDGD